MIKKILHRFKLFFYYSKNFGIEFGLCYLFTTKEYYKLRIKAIDICKKKFGYIFEKNYHFNYSIPIISDDQKNIFLFWAQGFDNLPPLVKESISRIKKYYYDYNIILLDLNNYTKYILLNKCIVDKFNKGFISIQTFSDILRFNLIYKYGGYWIDATILFFARLPLFDNLKKYGFYSINHESIQKQKIWGKIHPVTYTTFFFGTYKNSNIMKCCVDFYNEYYSIYKYNIDYFMNDFILILCMKYKIDNDILNKVPFTNSSPFILIDTMRNSKKIDTELIYEIPQKMDWRNFDAEQYKIILEKEKII